MASPAQAGPGIGPGNRLLAALPSEVYRRIEPHLEQVDLPQGRVLFEPGEPVTQVYFPNDSVVSLLAVMETGDSVDSAMVGREGLASYTAVFGDASATARNMVQLPGSAARLELRRLHSAQAESDTLRRLLLRYIESLSFQLLQTAACNALHRAEERCCRWLLMAQDRAGKDTLPLTQECLAGMVGVRRSSVNRIARTLQRAGLIDYRRGSVTILDRHALEAKGCECYGLIRRQFERSLPRTYA